MKRNAIYLIILLIGGFGINMAMPRLKFAKPHPLPIDTFPVNIGGWNGGPDVPPDPAVQKALPTATITERTYTDRKGRQVDLELITGSNYDDFHDPNVCFPAQGWIVHDEPPWHVDHTMASFMTAERDGTKIDFLYYLAGGYVSGIPLGGAALKKMYALRRLFTGEGGGSLVVRMSATDDPGSRQTLRDFAAAIQPAVDALVAEGKKDKS